MTSRPPFHGVDPPLQAATSAEAEAALRSFIERFVVPERRERALSLFVPLKKRARVQELIAMIDHACVIELSGSGKPGSREANALARLDRDLIGVFVDENRGCWATRLGVAIDQLSGDGAIFAATDGACGVVHRDIGSSWLLAPAT